jgi:hypothetical protein
MFAPLGMPTSSHVDWLSAVAARNAPTEGMGDLRGELAFGQPE